MKKNIFGIGLGAVGCVIFGMGVGIMIAKKAQGGHR